MDDPWRPESLGMCDGLNLHCYFTFRLGNNSIIEVRPGKRLEFETQKCADVKSWSVIVERKRRNGQDSAMMYRNFMEQNNIVALSRGYLQAK